MPSKSFKVGGTAGAEPITFDLEGVDTKGQPIQPITFLCKPTIQGVIIKNILALAGNELAAGLAVIDMIPEAIVLDQVALYEEIIHSEDIIVDAEVLAEIGRYLFEVYNTNPTNAASGSTAGSSPTGPTSMADYLSAPEPTLRPSVPVASATPPTQ